MQIYVMVAQCGLSVQELHLRAIAALLAEVKAK